MKIAFVTPPAAGGVILVADLLHGCWCHGSRVAGLRLPPLPQLLLAGIAGAAGHRCAVFDAPNQGQGQGQGWPAGRLLEAVEDADMVVLHVSAASYVTDRAFVARVKESRPAAAVLVYGAHPTFRPELFTDRSLYDHVLAHAPEAEFARIVSPGAAPTFASMDELPEIDTSLIPADARYFNPIGKHRRFATLVTSRGCPGRCSFCTVPAFYGPRFEAMSAPRVAREVAGLVRRGYREIFFRDENFTTSRTRVLETCAAIRGAVGAVDFIISSRVDLVDTELLRALKTAGCRYIRFGVESGSDALLASVGKRTDREMIVEAFRRTSEAGIRTHAHFIVGLPGEGAAEREATRQLVREIRPDTLTVGLFTPLPGSALYREVAGRGELPEIDASRLHLQARPDPSRDAKEREVLERFPAALYREYYLRPGYLARALLRTRSVEELAIKVRSAAGVAGFSFVR